MVACEKEKVVVQGGSFRLGESQYSIRKVKVEHVGYDADDYILRFIAYPTTYTVNENSSSGYGAVIDTYFCSATKDFEIGQSYQLFSDSSSFLKIYPEIPKGDTTHRDTIAYSIAKGKLCVDSVDGYRTFGIELITANGDSINGSYLGEYQYNYRLDQKGYGELHFDTISCQLAMPVMRNWGYLFSEISNYYEFTFYSIDARFSDLGKIKSGVQYVVGMHTMQSDWPMAGEYSVSTSVTNASVYYGHKLKNTSWGSYWQVFYNSSPIGKANIVEGSASILSIDEKKLNMTFVFVDQLGNEVVGFYDGPYSVASY